MVCTEVSLIRTRFEVRTTAEASPTAEPVEVEAVEAVEVVVAKALYSTRGSREVPVECIQTHESKFFKGTAIK